MRPIRTFNEFLKDALVKCSNCLEEFKLESVNKDYYCKSCEREHKLNKILNESNK